MMKKAPKRTRKNRVEVRFDDEELALIEEKMEKAHINSKSDYIRQMCVYGKVINFEDMYFRKCFTAMDRMGTNLNQITKVANSTGNIYLEDIQLLNSNISVVNNLMSEIYLKIETMLEKIEKKEVLALTEQISKEVEKLHKQDYL